jgi:ribosomal protein S18 acetylase RimI-like enzyme
MTCERRKKEGKIRIIIKPDLALFEKVIEYVNRNLASGAFPLLMRTDPIPKEQAKVWLDKNKAGEQAVAIAVDDGVVVGAAHMDVGCNEGGRTGAINVTVDKMYRRRGIGESLVRCLIDQAKEHGLVKVEAEPRADNLPAVSLFKKLGFEIASQRKLRTSAGEIVFHHMVLYLHQS